MKHAKYQREQLAALNALSEELQAVAFFCHNPLHKLIPSEYWQSPYNDYGGKIDCFIDPYVSVHLAVSFNPVRPTEYCIMFRITDMDDLDLSGDWELTLPNWITAKGVYDDLVVLDDAAMEYLAAHDIR